MQKINSLLFALLFFSFSCFAQSTNGYKFIEPNISIAFDPTQVRIGNDYSNSFYNKEAVDFTFYKDTGTKSVIHVAAERPLPEVPSVYFIDSVMLAGMKEIRGDFSKEVRIVAYDSVIRHIGGFSCAGFVVYDSEHKAYVTSITCNHLSANDMTEIRYKNFADTNLETGYKRIATFLTGFKSYSQVEIQKEEEQIKKTYTVTVKRLDNPPDSMKWIPHTFAGIVQIIPKPAHTIFGVLITQGIGKQLFQPDKENNIYITCRDDNSGVIKKSGTLVLLNSFGKKVELPFSFEYTK